MAGRWRWFRRRWTGRFWNRLAGRVGLGTIPYFSFRRLGKRLRSCERRRRACTAIAGRRFGGCWKFWIERKKNFNAEGAENAEFAEKRRRWRRRRKRRPAERKL